MVRTLESYWQRIAENSKQQWLVVGLILMGAVALRFYQLGEWSLWIEEHHTIRHVTAMNSLSSVFSDSRPFFYLLTKPIFGSLGINEWTARLLASLFGILAIPLVFYIAKKEINLPVAFLSALLLAISPWHIFWSQNARFYSLLLLLYTFSLFSFYWALETDKARYLVASILVLAVAGITHALAALLVPILVAYYLSVRLLPFEKPPGLRPRALVILVALPAAGYLMYELYRYVADITPLYQKMYALFFNRDTASFAGYGSPITMLQVSVYYLGVVLAYLSVPGAYYLIRDRRRIGLLLGFGAYGPLVMLMALTFVASTASRYAFMSMAVWAILAATGTIEIIRRSRSNKAHLLWWVGIPLLMSLDPALKDLVFYLEDGILLRFLLLFAGLVYLLLIVFVIRSSPSRLRTVSTLLGISLVYFLILHPIIVNTMYFAYQHGHRLDWKGASDLVRNGRVEGDLLVSSLPTLANYYLGDDLEVLGSSNEDKEALLQQGRRVWFIEEAGLRRHLGPIEPRFREVHCEARGVFDNYVGGTNFLFRVHLCEST